MFEMTIENRFGGELKTDKFDAHFNFVLKLQSKKNPKADYPSLKSKNQLWNPH